MIEEPNFLKQAFKHEFNLIGLATALGFALVSGTIVPLLFAAGAQMLILPLVASSERFQRYVRALQAEVERERSRQNKQLESSEMVAALPERERQRYGGLEAMAREIRLNYKGLDSSSQVLVDELVRKLEFLLSFYLRMRYSVVRYERYFATTDPERIQERIAMLAHEAETGPERIRQIKARTKVVLEKRLERYQKAVENKQLVEAQTETVLEVLQLLRDQSYSMRDPRSITEQLDGLVSSAEETERGVKEMEELLAGDQELLVSGGLGGEDIEAELRARPSSYGASQTPARPARSVVVPPAPPAPPPPPPRKRIIN